MKVKFTGEELEDLYNIDKLAKMEKHGIQFREALNKLLRDMDLAPEGKDILKDAEVCAITMRMCMEVLVEQNMLTRLLYEGATAESAAEGTSAILHDQFCSMLVTHINNKSDHFYALEEQLRINRETDVH